VGGESFRTRPDRPCGPPSLLNNGYRVFPGSKAAGAWRWPPTPSSTEVNERVQLYLYSPSGTSWPVLGWTLTILLPLPSVTISLLVWTFASAPSSQIHSVYDLPLDMKDQASHS